MGSAMLGITVVFDIPESMTLQNFLLLNLLKIICHIEGCKTLFVVGEIDEAEGTSLAAKIENLLLAATIEEQLHILKEVSKLLGFIIIKQRL
jgi:hypothetical protein